MLTLFPGFRSADFCLVSLSFGADFEEVSTFLALAASFGCSLASSLVEFFFA
jgi:hypothetical protein